MELVGLGTGEWTRPEQRVTLIGWRAVDGLGSSSNSKIDQNFLPQPQHELIPAAALKFFTSTLPHLQTLIPCAICVLTALLIPPAHLLQASSLYLLD